MPFKFNPFTSKLDVVNDGATLDSNEMDTEANILLLTPTAGRFAWATDLDQLMVADGTNWHVLSAYLDTNLSAPDIGYLQGSNRVGYGRTYISDKRISNSSFGSNGATVAGGVKYDEDELKLAAYLNGAWELIVSGVDLYEDSAVLKHIPNGYTSHIAAFSGNSDETGLNGLPIVQGYKVSMGSYPVKAQIDGGSF